MFSAAAITLQVGELIQIDGSQHSWFETHGPQCTLLVYIDDATSQLMHLQFVETESAFDYFKATWAYLEQHGKPVAFYVRQARVFRVNRKDASGGDGMTRKNHLFAGSDGGAERWAVVASLLATAKLNGVEPFRLPTRRTRAHVPWSSRQRHQ